MSQKATQKTILVVEDDEAISQTLLLALEIEGYTVLTASNGLQGIEVLRRVKAPSLILLDFMMPVMNGWEFLQSIRKEKIAPSVPVVVLTAFADRATGVDACAIIKKPFSLDALLGTVREHCLTS